MLRCWQVFSRRWRWREITSFYLKYVYGWLNVVMHLKPLADLNPQVWPNSLTTSIVISDGQYAIMSEEGDSSWQIYEIGIITIKMSILLPPPRNKNEDDEDAFTKITGYFVKIPFLALCDDAHQLK